MNQLMINRNMYIKTIKFIFSVTLIMLTSCNDWLETLPPDGLVFDEYWKTKEDVESTLMGAYQGFAKMDERLFLYGELRADMIVEDDNMIQDERLIKNGDIFTDNYLCNWTGFYEIINYCNNVLKYAPGVLEIDPTFTEFMMEAYRSEALVLRALAYFYLVRVFNDVPLVLEPSDDDNVNFFPSKTSGDEILQLVKEDLKEARLKLRNDYGNEEENKGRVTQGAADAILADICLWNFEYEESLTYLNNVINSERYFLQPTIRWFDIYNPGNSFEGIFELQFDEQNDQSNTLYRNTYQRNYYIASLYAQEILLPELSGENIRGNGTISQESIGYKIWKYCGAAPDQRTVRPASVSNSANWIMYRYADILLMKAEALSQLERYGEALELINEVRRRALMPERTISFTPEAFEDAILEERAKELAFEGKRWFDLLRMGRRNGYANKDELIEIIVENVSSTKRLLLASKLADPNGWYFPVHADEIETNPNITQNPFYEN